MHINQVVEVSLQVKYNFINYLDLSALKVITLEL